MMIYLYLKKRLVICRHQRSPTSHEMVLVLPVCLCFCLPLEHILEELSVQTRVNEPSWLVVEAPSALKNLFVKIGSLEPSFGAKKTQKHRNEPAT